MKMERVALIGAGAVGAYFIEGLSNALPSRKPYIECARM